MQTKHPKRVLIVDDDYDTVEYLAAMLKLEGYETLTATSAAEGWAQFRHRRPNLILTDLRMPGRNGEDLIYEVLSQGAECPIIAMSGGYDKAELQLEMANALGANLVLGKPINRTALLNAVQQLIGSPTSSEAFSA